MKKKSDHVPQTESTRPEPPPHLSDKVRAIFSDLVPAEIHTPAQIALLVRALESIDLADQCYREILRDGVGQTSERSGLARQHPLMTPMKESSALALKIFQALRITDYKSVWDEGL